MTKKYFDKNGNEIKEGMYIIYEGEENGQLVYLSVNGDLGLNASNESHSEFCEFSRQLYSLSEFDMREWEIVV